MALLASLAFRNLHVSVGMMRRMRRTMKRNK
jgi:hypothetical protein